MPSIFFLSYARHRKECLQTADQLDRWVQKLTEIVGMKVQGAGDQLGFRDTGSIEAGTPQWSDELKQKLVSHPIGIVLFSPQYFEPERTWCKWEYTYLVTRNSVVSKIDSSIVPVTPRLVLVLDWVRTEARDLPANLSSEVQRVGESIVKNADENDLRAVRSVLERGVWDTIKLLEDGDSAAKSDYGRFMLCLGEYVVEQWNRWVLCSEAIKRHNLAVPVPPEFDGNDRWQPSRITNAGAPAAVRSAQRRKVYVIYVAAQPHEVPSPRSWRYREDGEYDWRPFGGPVEEECEPHVGELLHSLENIEVREWHFDHFCDHMDELMKLAGNRFPVLFIVDPWTTTQLERYRLVLKRYAESEHDGHAFSAPIVIWNGQDPETESVHSDFKKDVAIVFDRNRWEQTFDREEFVKALAATVRSLQARIRNNGADERLSTGSGLLRISATP